MPPSKNADSTGGAARAALLIFALVIGVSTASCEEEGESLRTPLPDRETIAALPPDGGPEFNRLIFESSPYLLQHARNPVDWRPWGPEAFAQAKAENKPVFLSVGYSTCHWCHVMEHESFENEEVAALMNELYICIKVDREERPDLDAIYMSATQLITQRGGWPNSVWLMPDGRPWFAGTYFPPEDGQGRPGFKTVLRKLNELWTLRRSDVEEQAGRLADAISQHGNDTSAAEGETPTLALLDRAVADLRSNFDSRNGGFGGAPKFPPHQSLELLIAAGVEGSLDMLTTTLDAMAHGGVHDHVGGGFHRYSTDARWFLPHFEKMLYDNAQLLPVYAEAWRLTGRGEYAEVARGIAAWALREMADPAGGFYCALDADSEGEEGKFYLWRQSELNGILGEAEGELFGRVYGAIPGGNYREEASGHSPGTNLLYLSARIDELAEREGLEPGALAARLSAAREKLRLVRDARIWPHLDDKVLASWNGLMIGGFARAGAILGEEEWIDAAGRAADFLLTTMTAEGRLLRSYRDGRARLQAYLDDYAFVALGLLDLHAATGDVRRLEQARALTDTLISGYWDGEAGGFYFTAADHEELLLRSKDAYDNAIPAGNGIAAQVLFRLAALTGDESYGERGRVCLQAFSGAMARSPRGTATLLRALALDPGAAASGWEIAEPEGATGPPAAAANRGPVMAQAYLGSASVAPGGGVAVAVRLTTKAGWHLNSHEPLQEYLAPTVLALAGGDGVELTAVDYPPGEPARFDFSDSSLSLYAGETWLRATLSVASGAEPGARRALLRLDYQACDESRCLAPAQLLLGVDLRVDAGARPGSRHAALFARLR